MTKRQSALLDRLEAWFSEHPHATPGEAAADMRMPVEAVIAVVGLGVSVGRLTLVGPGVYTEQGLRSLVSELRQKLGVGPFSPRQMREALAVGRGGLDQLADVLTRRGELTREPGGWRLEQG